MSILPPGFSVSLPSRGSGKHYARNVLEDCGACVNFVSTTDIDHPSTSWANSGLMALTGATKGFPQICPVPLPDCADDVLEAFRALANIDILPGVKGSQLLVERAAITGPQEIRPTSSGGHCRLLATRNGRIGLNLARDDDWQLLPAWLGVYDTHDWCAIESLVATMPTPILLKQGRLLGLPVVDAASIPTGYCDWVNIAHRSNAVPARTHAPRVLDLSSLWAGPLCSHLWQAAGAHVIKLESSQRPDGARSGALEFFDLLNQGKQSIVLDLHTKAGQRELLELMQHVDIVIEGSRPRALHQMGIIAEEVISANPGLSWVSITGYGRQTPQSNWTAFGDDAGIAAGLSAILFSATGQWSICGDAIADPLTGLHAALAGWASWLAGGGHLLDLSLEGTVRHCITATSPKDNNYLDRHIRWMKYLQDNQIVAQTPKRRSGG